MRKKVVKSEKDYEQSADFIIEYFRRINRIINDESEAIFFEEKVLNNPSLRFDLVHLHEDKKFIKEFKLNQKKSKVNNQPSSK